MKTSREGYERILAAYEEQLKIQTAEYARRKKLYEDGELDEAYVRAAARDVVRTRTNIIEIQRWIFEDDLASTELVARTAPPLGAGGYEDSALFVRYNGQTAWSLRDAGKIESFFLARFGRALPVSARGQTAAHDRMGFDHHNAMDVALYPDSEEGRAVMQYLKQSGIPFIAFRGKMAGAATGAHIHIGKPSLRLASPR
ncbi:MAG TPA: hypothetical protein VGH16_09365 [Candidatus Binatia bacterium]|jgi:hypothetical protein